MRMNILEVSRFEDLLANWGKDLRQKILDVFFWYNLFDGMRVQML